MIHVIAKICKAIIQRIISVFNNNIIISYLNNSTYKFLIFFSHMKILSQISGIIIILLNQ